jgi:hypothetical protein
MLAWIDKLWRLQESSVDRRDFLQIDWGVWS